MPNEHKRSTEIFRRVLNSLRKFSIVFCHFWVPDIFFKFCLWSGRLRKTWRIIKNNKKCNFFRVHFDHNEFEHFSPPKNFYGPPNNPRGSRYAKITRKLANFQVLELQKVFGGSDKVATVIKKFYLDKMKMFCDKIFLSRVIQEAQGQKITKKAPFLAIFHYFTIKTSLKKIFEMGLHVT